MLLPSQQGPSGGGGADSCALSADVNCLDGRHRAKRANEKMSGSTGRTDEHGQADVWRHLPPSQYSVTKRIQDRSTTTHTPLIQWAICIHTV